MLGHALAAPRGAGEHRSGLRAAATGSAWRERANELAGSLAYGEQRRLEIARALGTNPGVILLDEPAAGTNPAEKRELADADQAASTSTTASACC